MEKNRTKTGLIILFSMILSAACIMLYSTHSPLYTFMENNDVHCFITTARCMLRGDVLYRDIYEQKGPILYFIYMLGLMIDSKSFLGIACIEMIFYTVYIFFCYKIIALFVDNRVIKCVLTFIVAWISCCEAAFGDGGQCEEFVLPFLCITIFIVLRYFTKIYPKRMPLAQVGVIGFCFAMVFWMKYTLTGLYVGLVLFIMVYQIKDKHVKDLFLYIIMFILGFCIGSVPAIVYFLCNDGLKPLWDVYFYRLIFMYGGKTTGRKITILQMLFSENVISENMLITCCYLASLLYCIARKDNHWNRHTKRAVGVMILSLLLGISVSYYWYYSMEPSAVFVVTGILAVYFLIYDARGWMKFCLKKICDCIDRILTESYSDIGYLVLLFGLIAVSVAYKPFIILLEVFAGVWCARVLLRTEDKLSDYVGKNKEWVAICKYCIGFLLLAENLEILQKTVAVSVIMLLAHDGRRYGQSLMNIFRRIIHMITDRVRTGILKGIGCLVMGVCGLIFMLNHTLAMHPFQESEENYPQIQIAKQIEKSGITAPKILYWDCNDVGIYWLTDTYPPYKYFWTYNLPGDEIKDMFRDGMNSGYIDFVVSGSKLVNKNYELEYVGYRDFHDQENVAYYLYKKKG